MTANSSAVTSRVIDEIEAAAGVPSGTTVYVLAHVFTTSVMVTMLTYFSYTRTGSSARRTCSLSRSVKAQKMQLSMWSH